jgi:uncharacterized membrane protein YedE/YeeE
MDTLILHDLEPWHWSVVGGALGLLTLLLLYITNVRLGMSTGFESVCALFSRKPYFHRPKLTPTNTRRLILFVGCLMGGALSAVLAGGWEPTWGMGRFDTRHPRRLRDPPRQRLHQRSRRVRLPQPRRGQHPRHVRLHGGRRRRVQRPLPRHLRLSREDPMSNTTLNVFYLAWAIVFGVVLSRSGVGDYEFIQQMFLFESFQLYGFLAVGVAIIGPGLWLLKRHGKTVTGEPLVVKPKPIHAGNIVGGLIFGVGWSMTGMCPGPMFVNIGEGKLYALAAIAGAVVGTWLVGALYDRLSAAFGLEPLPAAEDAAAG